MEPRTRSLSLLLHTNLLPLMDRGNRITKCTQHTSQNFLVICLSSEALSNVIKHSPYTLNTQRVRFVVIPWVSHHRLDINPPMCQAWINLRGLSLLVRADHWIKHVVSDYGIAHRILPYGPTVNRYEEIFLLGFGSTKYR
jgi:hypothetical protein